MEKLGTKILKGIIAMMLVIMLLVIPTYVFGAEANTQNEKIQTQIINTAQENYIIYIKGLTDKDFKFSISNNANATEMELGYINSVKDEDGNSVVLITEEKLQELGENAKIYLYVKTDTEVLSKGINLKDSFSQSKIKEVENTTKRIETKIETDITKQDKEVNGVKVKVTVGGLKITDKSNADYYYSRTKLPKVEYTELVKLANKINNEYNEMDIYNKIETSKEFYNLYSKLLEEQNWKKVENKTIIQPEDAQKDEQYVVYLKKVDENKTETIDMKIMTSYREDEEEKIPGKTETKVVKETTKLPITGESIILFVILAVIILVAIIVFVRMKKLEGNTNKE